MLLLYLVATVSCEMLEISSPPVTLPSGGALILFHTEWCGHCRKLFPEFKKAAETNLPVLWGAVNCEKTSLCENVHSFPTIYYFSDPDSLADFPVNGFPVQAGRTTDALVAFARRAVAPDYLVIANESEVLAVAKANDMWLPTLVLVPRVPNQPVPSVLKQFKDKHLSLILASSLHCTHYHLIEGNQWCVYAESEFGRVEMPEGLGITEWLESGLICPGVWYLNDDQLIPFSHTCAVGGTRLLMVADPTGTYAVECHQGLAVAVVDGLAWVEGLREFGVTDFPAAVLFASSDFEEFWRLNPGNICEELKILGEPIQRGSIYARLLWVSAFAQAHAIAVSAAVVAGTALLWLFYHTFGKIKID